MSERVQSNDHESCHLRLPLPAVLGPHPVYGVPSTHSILCQVFWPVGDQKPVIYLGGIALCAIAQSDNVLESVNSKFSSQERFPDALDVVLHCHASV